MADKMVIIGNDGIERYLVDEENHVTDLRSDVNCTCGEASLVQKNGEQLTCLVCGLIILT